MSCSNYRGISLINIEDKVMSLILLDTLTSYIDCQISDYQCGRTASLWTRYSQFGNSWRNAGNSIKAFTSCLLILSKHTTVFWRSSCRVRWQNLEYPKNSLTSQGHVLKNRLVRWGLDDPQRESRRSFQLITDPNRAMLYPRCYLMWRRGRTWNIAIWRPRTTSYTGFCGYRHRGKFDDCH